MKTWMAGALLLSASTGFGSAQIPAPPQVSREEIRATVLYLDKVRPIIYRQRQQLTPLISPEDQQQLTAYHARIRQRALDQRTASPLLQEHVRKQNRRMEVQEWRALQLLIAKYTTPCQQLTSKLTPQQRQWHADLRAIHRRHAGAGHTCTAAEHISSLGLVDWMLTPAGFLTLQLPQELEK